MSRHVCWGHVLKNESLQPRYLKNILWISSSFYLVFSYESKTKVIQLPSRHTRMLPFQQIISFDASFIDHWNIILPDFSFVTSNTMLNIQSNKSFVESPLFPTFRDLSFHIHRTKIDQTILKPTQLSSDLTISYSITNLEKYQNHQKKTSFCPTDTNSRHWQSDNILLFEILWRVQKFY